MATGIAIHCGIAAWLRAPTPSLAAQRETVHAQPVHTSPSTAALTAQSPPFGSQLRRVSAWGRSRCRTRASAIAETKPADLIAWNSASVMDGTG